MFGKKSFSYLKILKKVCQEQIDTLWQYIFNIRFFIQSDIEWFIRIISSQESNLIFFKYQDEKYKKIINALINNIKYYTLTSPQRS